MGQHLPLHDFLANSLASSTTGSRKMLDKYQIKKYGF